MMDLQTMVNVILGGLGGLMAIILSNLRALIESVRQSQVESDSKLQKVELLVAGNYVTKAEQADSDKKVTATLQRIEDKLDNVPCKKIYIKQQSHEI
jgi:hypothetical protein